MKYAIHFILRIFLSFVSWLIFDALKGLNSMTLHTLKH